MRSNVAINPGQVRKFQNSFVEASTRKMSLKLNTYLAHIPNRQMLLKRNKHQKLNLLKTNDMTERSVIECWQTTAILVKKMLLLAKNAIHFLNSLQYFTHFWMSAYSHTWYGLNFFLFKLCWRVVDSDEIRSNCSLKGWSLLSLPSLRNADRALER